MVMNFKKMLKEKRMVIPTDNLMKSANPDGGVLAWSGYVLVYKADSDKAESLQETLNVNTPCVEA